MLDAVAVPLSLSTLLRASPSPAMLLSGERLITGAFNKTAPFIKFELNSASAYRGTLRLHLAVSKSGFGSE